MTELVAWVLFPLVFFAIATGVGLLGETAARIALPDALLAPVGACLCVPVVLLELRLGAAGAVMGLSLLALAVAGLALRRERLPGCLAPGWAGIAALLAFALFMGPVVLSGHWTWLGYNFVNDTSSNTAVIEHLAQHGTAPDPGLTSTRLVVVNGALAQHYPLGAHGLVAALEWLVPAPVEAVYQVYIACVAAFAAMSFTWLARSVGVRGPGAALAALVAVGANLAYQYALQGSFKELTLICVVATGAALLRLTLDLRLATGAVVLLGACMAAAVGVFTAGAAGYAGGIAAVALLAVLIERPPQRVPALARAVVAGPIALAIAVGPVLADSIHFAQRGSEIFANTNADLSVALKSPAVLGHLARPLPIFQALGTWLRQDYRYPNAGFANTATLILLALAFALILVVAVVELRRRRLGALLAIVPPLLVYLIAAPRLEPYARAKLLVVLSPLAVFAATVGAWWLFHRVRAAGIAVAVALFGGVIFSDALAYRNAHIVPVQRMAALRDAAEHASGRGPWLLPEWEELAKHFGKAAPINVASESFSPRSVALREPEIIFDHSFDLDQMTLPYVESWPGIMLRRSPDASRPPANYRLTYRNAYYELWEQKPDGPQVLDHLALQRAGQASVPPRCQDVRDLVARLQPGDRLVAARRAPLPTVGVTVPPIYGATRPDVVPNWAPSPDPQDPGTLITNGQGIVAGRLRVGAGAYEVWVRGGGGRPLRVSVDGRLVGAQRQLNTPEQWLPIGRVTLPAGTHRVSLRRPGAGFEPGNGVNGPVGGIALEPQVPHPLVTVPKARAASLCNQPWDWIERVH
jgi:hypothetical protein